MVPCAYDLAEVIGQVTHTYAILAMQKYVLRTCGYGVLVCKRCQWRLRKCRIL